MVCANGEAPTPVAPLAVSEGETIDFVTDCLQHESSDSFRWPVELTLAGDDGEAAAVFASRSGFQGPAAAKRPALEIGSVVRAWQLAYLRLPHA